MGCVSGAWAIAGVAAVREFGNMAVVGSGASGILSFSHIWLRGDVCPSAGESGGDLR